MGKTHCGCEFVDGVVVNMCKEHADDMDRHFLDIGRVHEELLTELFGSVPEDVASLTVSRSTYTKAMHKVQDRYGLKQGHPKFIEWLFTCIGKSPMIEGEEEGKEEHATTTH